MPDGSLKRQTVYYVTERKYAKLVDTTYTNLTNCYKYANNTAYAVNTYVATYADGATEDDKPNAIYKVTTAVPATNTNPPATNASFTLDTTGMLANETYAVINRRIPTDIAVYLVWADSRRQYGCNIYAESNYRQYVNNLNGAGDAHYKL